ncbi:iron-sulfur cluster carrier protein ApbC [Paraferrimonas sedimenticola]|uniref:Iron-sulfur cluster carrier protein n=1 Tax=Paraferrimonas sedimenticola TaxID=375674 RepID=A0AA37RZD5_9GAMM|nr:iron-sulfur cluster carrier protein ApbC [Paraferrimonas sedimenticola]GLP98090.1 iron-sulfur cluster carrier protein [Paraferrimonas sedimenticola]
MSQQQDFQLAPELLAPVLAVLNQQQDPYLEQGLVDAGIVVKLGLEGKQLQLGLCYPYTCVSTYRDRVMSITKALVVIDAIDEVSCEIDFQPPKAQFNDKASKIDNIKHVIAVSSGKGGVGKSTTAVNFALALAAEGAKVGILDADIYGPSVPIMLGVQDFRPTSADGKTMSAAYAHGITAQSIGFMIQDEQAAVWRGPMAAGALGQLIKETEWPELDYLVVDMPPGTGDIQLSLSQHVPVSGAVVVTTPQDIATADAKKGITMFNKTNIPVLGIVENMSFYLCPECGNKDHIFGEDGGLNIAKRYKVPLLGRLPLNTQIRNEVDNGNPTLVADPDGDVSALYKAIARQASAELVKLGSNATLSIEITEE